MFVTTHILAGALLGTALRRHPLLALPAGVLSHLAMDAIPHWGMEDREGFLAIAAVDGIVAMFAAVLLLFVFDRRSRLAVGVAMFGAVLLDANKPFQEFWGFSPFPHAVDHLHGAVQIESAGNLSFELALAGILLVVAWFVASSARYVTSAGPGRHRSPGTARIGGQVTARRALRASAGAALPEGRTGHAQTFSRRRDLASA